MPRIEVTVVPAEALAGAVAAWLAERTVRAIALRGRCALALSGGATPRPAYQALAERGLADRVDWEKVDVYFADERAVPPEHPESNFRMAMDALLGQVPLPSGNAHRMAADRPDRDAAAREYEGLLPPCLDVLLLGMGGDGHTASLFPGSPALQERRRRVVPAESPLPPAGRLTITPPVIAGADAVAVMVSGAGKAAMVARALDGPSTPLAVPVQLATGARWFLDEAAASRLAVERRRA